MMILALAACGSSSSNKTPSQPGSPNGQSDNLIVNGDAEAAVGSAGGDPVATPPWVSTGEATAIQYGSGGYPDASEGPPDPGMNFFAGGENDAMSSLEQLVDVTQYTTAIDAGSVTYILSGWLGGYSDQGDNATLAVTFEDATGTPLGTATIGPVTETDRMGTTGFLQETMDGSVPKGTRSVDVLLTMIRTDGANNDGYADDLSLVFGGV